MAATETFPDVGITVGSGKNISRRVRTSVFGDGYEQRVQDGLNTEREVWNMGFTDISNTRADTIEAFLSARNGTEPFLWTSPEIGATEKQYVENPGSYNRVPNSVNTATVTFQMRQVFDL